MWRTWTRPWRSNPPLLTDFLTALVLRRPVRGTTSFQRNVRHYRFFNAWTVVFGVTATVAMNVALLVDADAVRIAGGIALGLGMAAASCWYESRQHAAWLRGYEAASGEDGAWLNKEEAS